MVELPVFDMISKEGNKSWWISSMVVYELGSNSCSFEAGYGSCD